MIVNCENGSDEATRIVVAFLLLLPDFVLKSLESFKYSRLKSVDFIFVVRFLLRT